MKKAVIIGSGAGGAAAAAELCGDFNVTILECGKRFEPSGFDVTSFEWLRHSGLLFDPVLMKTTLPVMRVARSKDTIFCCGHCLGGSVNLSAGNALRYDEDLRKIGIDLDKEFDELFSEISVATDHKSRWNKINLKLYDIMDEMGLSPFAAPKMIDMKKCRNCGQCTMGCPYGAKWTVMPMLEKCAENGVRIVTGCKVKKLIIEGNRVTGIVVSEKMQRKVYKADFIILAAGGMGTPQILEASGIRTEKNFFGDPVLCWCGQYEGAKHYKGLPMPFISQLDEYMISPYFDTLSFFFNKNWRIPCDDIISLMVKYKDTPSGYITKNGRIYKERTANDIRVLKESGEMCREIFRRMGIPNDRIFAGTLNAGHPGGTLPLTVNEAETLHNERLPENLYVADSSLFIRSMGNPPIITIMALSKHIACICKEKIL